MKELSPWLSSRRAHANSLAAEDERRTRHSCKSPNRDHVGRDGQRRSGHRHCRTLSSLSDSKADAARAPFASLEAGSGRTIPTSPRSSIFYGRRRPRHEAVLACTFLVGIMALLSVWNSGNKNGRLALWRRRPSTAPATAGRDPSWQARSRGRAPGIALARKVDWNPWDEKDSSEYWSQSIKDTGDRRHRGDPSARRDAFVGRDSASVDRRDPFNDEPPPGGGEADTLADGTARCFVDDDADDAGGASLGTGVRKCLPTVFFFGVSKSGTTTLCNWMAEHPKTRYSPPAPGHDFRETHLFDYPPALWAATKSTMLIDRLASEARPDDIVIDFTPHYAAVSEAPHRIADFYGDGPLRRKLKFLVLLRDPVSRTISSWQYKSKGDEPVSTEPARTEAPPAVQRMMRESLYTSQRSRKRKLSVSADNDQNGRVTQNSSPAATPSAMSKEEKEAARREFALERRPLSAVMEEGRERVANMSACFANATKLNLFGSEQQVTECRTTKGKKQCEGHPPCEICSTHTEPWCNARGFLEENMYNAHVGKSMYAMQLSRWLSLFGRENVKVVFTEHMAVNPISVLEEVFEFIGLDMLDPEGNKGLRSLDEWRNITGVKFNTADRTVKARLDPQLTPEILQQMREYFAPFNRALEDLLGTKVPASWNG